MHTSFCGYWWCNTEWNHGLGSDDVYKPVHVSLDQPPITVKIQGTVNTDFMNREAHYCIIAYRRYKHCLYCWYSNISVTAIYTNDKPKADGFCAFSPSHVDTGPKAATKINTEVDPFTALSVFLTKQQSCLLESSSWKNPTMQSLLQIAMKSMQQSPIAKKSSLIKHQVFATLEPNMTKGYWTQQNTRNTTRRHYKKKMCRFLKP